MHLPDEVLVHAWWMGVGGLGLGFGLGLAFAGGLTGGLGLGLDTDAGLVADGEGLVRGVRDGFEAALGLAVDDADADAATSGRGAGAAAVGGVKDAGLLLSSCVAA
jgi:hypothetical protein